MTNSAKIGIAVSGLALAGVAGYLVYLHVQETNAKKAAELESALSAAVHTATNIIKKQTTVTAPPRTDTGFTATTSKLKMGDKLFAPAKGANVYKTAAANTANLYKHYNSGSYIGTYLSDAGFFSKIIVDEPGVLYGTNPKTVFIPTSDLK